MQNKFTEAEYETLKYEMKHISTHLPEHLTGLIWSSYVQIKGKPEPQPCNCASAGGLWKGAVDTINDWIKSVEVNVD